jgi:2-polyprenyl-3-methyl-5-hydroxy-6-metoxy-1,4-benzoquinol methylase/DNA-directed RNA polymerase subunit RPC12/RpoP
MKYHCLNCKSPDFADYLSINNYNYKRCKSCGLVQLVPLPTIEELTSFYNEEYYTKNYDINRISIIRDQTQIQYEIVERNYKTEKGTRFLDFGCGVGYFLERLKATGHEFIYGYEFNSASLKIIGDKGYNSILNLEQNIQKFDVITLWDVAEHLVDPINSFKMLHEKLNNNGVLVIGTARIDDFVDRTALGYTMWADPPGHTILYSKKTLQMILKNAGFENNWIDTKHTLANIYNSKYQMIRRLVKKLVFFSKTDRKNKKGDFGSYQVIISKK